MNAQLISEIKTALSSQSRVILAIAGGPASGKSTISEKLLEEFGHQAVVLPMDGFHLDNHILDQMDLRARKGAPETFDVEGFHSLIARVASGASVFAPKFDRELDLSRAGAITFDNQPLVIIEGNYLLFDEAPWNELPQYWDLSLEITVPIEVVEERCTQRWVDHGFTFEAAQKRARDNDVRNARRVLSNRVAKDLPAVLEYKDGDNHYCLRRH